MQTGWALSGDALLGRTARVTDASIAAVRRRAGTVLDRVELWLKAQEAARDPEGKAWAEQVRRDIESGELRRRHEATNLSINSITVDLHAGEHAARGSSPTS